MKLDELKQERANKVEEMNQLIKTVDENQRDFNKDETSKWESLRNEVEDIDKKINMLEKQDELNRSIVNNTNNEELNKNETMNKKRKLDEIVSENLRGNTISDFKITTRDVTTDANITSVDVEGLSVIGKKSMAERLKALGIKYMNNLSGDVKLPYLQPVVAGYVDESEAYSNSESLGSVNLSVGRVSITETFTKEILKSGNEAVIAELIDEMMVGCERKLESKIYDVALDDSTEISGVTSISYENIMKLEKELDADGIYLMPRSLFYDSKAVKLDDGSGKFLFNKVSNEFGESFEGTPALYSNLFSGSQIVYSQPQSIVVGDWGSYDVTFDIYSGANRGEVYITVAKIANVVSRNPKGSVKSKL
ncbi:MAG: hypothetical protein ACOCVF_03390 [bacterium]